MWGHLCTELGNLYNFNVSFSTHKSEILLHLSQWQYWWWFWFSFFWTFYFFVITRVIKHRVFKMNIRLNTSFRSRGKWGDYLVTLIPLSWCLNILLNSNFILRMIEWQAESGVLIIRIHGKQWYWVYKYDLQNMNSILTSPKNVGTKKWTSNRMDGIDANDKLLNLTQLKIQNISQEEYTQEAFNKDFNSASFNAVETPKLKKLQIGLQTKTIKLPLFNNPSCNNSPWVQNLAELDIFNNSTNKYDNPNTNIHPTILLYTDTIVNPKARKRTMFFNENPDIAQYIKEQKIKAQKNIYVSFFKNLQLEQSKQINLTVHNKLIKKKTTPNFTNISKERANIIARIVKAQWARHDRQISPDVSIMLTMQKLPAAVEEIFPKTESFFRHTLAKLVSANVNNTTNFYDNVALDDEWEVYSNLRAFEGEKSVRITPNIINLNTLAENQFKFFSLKFFDSSEKIIIKPEENVEFLVVKQKRYKRKQGFKPLEINLKNSIDSTESSIKTQRFLKNNLIFTTVFNKLDTESFNFYSSVRLNKTRSEKFSINLTRRLLRTTRTLVIPAYTNISIIANSYDVVHSWFIPGLGLKIDCVPGKSTHHSLYVDNVGLYYGQCAEVCGRYHHHMPIRVCAIPFDHFVVWWTSKGLPSLLKMKYDPKNVNKTLLTKYVW